MMQSLKILIRQKRCLIWQIIISHALIFLINQETDAENAFMMLNELVLAFKINLHYHKYFHNLKFSLLQTAWRINEWRMCY